MQKECSGCADLWRQVNRSARKCFQIDARLRFAPAAAISGQQRAALRSEIEKHGY